MREGFKRKKAVLFVAGLIFSILIITLIMMINADNRKADSIQDTMNMANRYLEDLEYEQAIAAYKAVIEIDPNNVDAYLGLADAYIGQGNYEDAGNALRNGYENTQDDRVYVRLNEIEEFLNNAVSENTVTMDAFAEGKDVEEEKTYLKEEADHETYDTESVSDNDVSDDSLDEIIELNDEIEQQNPSVSDDEMNEQKEGLDAGISTPVIEEDSIQEKENKVEQEAVLIEESEANSESTVQVAENTVRTGMVNYEITPQGCKQLYTTKYGRVHGEVEEIVTAGTIVFSEHTPEYYKDNDNYIGTTVTFRSDVNVLSSSYYFAIIDRYSGEVMYFDIRVLGGGRASWGVYDLPDGKEIWLERVQDRYIDFNYEVAVNIEYPNNYDGIVAVFGYASEELYEMVRVDERGFTTKQKCAKFFSPENGHEYYYYSYTNR